MLTGIAAGLAAGALWGMVFVAPRMAGAFSPVDFTAGRFVSYGLLSLVLVVLARRVALPSLRQALAAAGMSILGFTGYYLLLVLAIRDAGTEVPSLVIGTIPVWMLLLGRPAGLRFGALFPGLVLTLAGLALMVHASIGSASPASAIHFWRGVAFAVASMVFWTAFGLVNASWLKRHPEVNATTWANWLGVATGLGALVLWGVAGSNMVELSARPGAGQAALLCVVTGIGSAWLATVLWNVASRRLSASLCGQLILSETIFALGYSFLWDGNWPSLIQALACLLFAAGILASIHAHTGTHSSHDRS
ncbi:MAG: family transporter [Polaromonas sp.]|nr:family transporter [Polaromonas sp.]